MGSLNGGGVGAAPASGLTPQPGDPFAGFTPSSVNTTTHQNILGNMSPAQAIQAQPVQQAQPGGLSPLSALLGSGMQAQGLYTPKQQPQTTQVMPQNQGMGAMAGMMGGTQPQPTLADMYGTYENNGFLGFGANGDPNYEMKGTDPALATAAVQQPSGVNPAPTPTPMGVAPSDGPAAPPVLNDAQKAYQNMMGGGFVGGVIPGLTPNRQPQHGGGFGPQPTWQPQQNPWDTLQQIGFSNPVQATNPGMGTQGASMWPGVWN